jgi:ribonuclease T2
MMPASVQQLVSTARADKQNSTDFFKTTLSLSSNEYSTYNMLKNAGIEPTDSKTFTLKDIQAAITKGLGGKVTKFNIGCSTDESGNSWLSDMLICIDKNYMPIDCVSYRPSRCKSTGIKYPVHKKNAFMPIF